MKLATLRNNDRDGTLILVNRALTHAIHADDIAPNLQAALDDWVNCSSKLETRYREFNETSSQAAFPFVASACTAPLPRAYQWVDGSAYVNHVELVRKARGAELPGSFWTEPLVYQGGSDDFIGPCDDIVVPSEDYGIDLEGETAIITDDIAMGTVAADAEAHIKLVMLVNDVSLRNLIPNELAKGFGFFQGKPSTAFSPVAVTPDELGEAWRDGTVQHRLTVHVNDELFGEPMCGVDMTFNFHQLIEHITKTRNARSGTIIGSGTISNYDRSRGGACIAEKRVLETLETGAPNTSFLKFGDKVRIEMFNEEGKSIFGAINQQVSRS